MGEAPLGSKFSTFYMLSNNRGALIKGCVQNNDGMEPLFFRRNYRGRDYENYQSMLLLPEDKIQSGKLLDIFKLLFQMLTCNPFAHFPCK